MKKIVVIKLGWVLVGEVTAKGDRLIIKNAGCIRLWGTSAGLGELAMNGPTKDTVIDPIGIVHVERSAVLFVILCDSPKWN